MVTERNAKTLHASFAQGRTASVIAKPTSTTRQVTPETTHRHSRDSDTYDRQALFHDDAGAEKADAGDDLRGDTGGAGVLLEGVGARS